MRPRARKLGRPPVKQDEIVLNLRRQIVQGLLAPGARLPRRSNIEEVFHASTVTVQRAFRRLARDGFIEARGNLGTFVSENPPHLNRYGLIFPWREAVHNRWSLMWIAMRHEALNLAQSGGRQIETCYDAAGHQGLGDYQRLVRSIENHCLAGLVIVAGLDQLVGTPVLDHPGLPRVAFWCEAPEIPHLSFVHVDYRNFFERAVEYLSHRRRKIAVVGAVKDMALFDQLVRQRGLTTHPYWIHRISPMAPATAADVTHLLMHNEDDRPDAIIIPDDNLVEHATAGLLAAGAKVPDDVEVVAHCNFPLPPPSMVPVKRLGFDVREILRRCLDNIDMERRGEKPPRVTLVPAVFEEEIEPASSHATIHEFQKG